MENLMNNKEKNFGKDKFGFGCMRLPMLDEKVDIDQFKIMVDEYMASGFNYFDTAHVYLNGQSETALKEALTSRYPRENFIFTNKLTTYFFEKEEEIVPLFEKQLEACGLDYFDYYLMHAQSEDKYEKYKKCRAYEIAFGLKELGKIKHVGISFHDKAEVLELILSEYPEIEVVQLQLNYLDFDDNVVQGRECYEICKKYNKPVIVMEPVKGGSLANLPTDAKEVLDNLNAGSPVSYAMRFVASLDQVVTVLSGVSSIEQLRENSETMKAFKVLQPNEYKALDKVCEIFKSQNLIPCTDCKYCVDGCPKNILIPNLFSCMNTKKVFNNWNTDYYYTNVYTVSNGKASDCINCKKCEKACPQHLEITSLLKDVADEFEKK